MQPGEPAETSRLTTPKRNREGVTPRRNRQK